MGQSLIKNPIDQQPTKIYPRTWNQSHMLSGSGIQAIQYGGKPGQI